MHSDARINSTLSDRLKASSKSLEEEEEERISDDPALNLLHQVQEVTASLLLPPSYLISQWNFTLIDIQQQKQQEFIYLQDLIKNVKASQKYLQDFRLLQAEKLCSNVEQVGGIAAWQETNPFINSLEFFITFKELFSDEKLLVHFLGDSFAKGTSYEGERAEKITTFVSKFLTQLNEEQIIDFFGSKEKFQYLKQAVESAMESSQWLQSTHVTDFSQAAEELKQFIEKKLEQGLPCLLNSGWTGSVSGHAIYLEISPQTNGKYSIFLYNRGKGIEYHEPPSSGESEYKSLYPAFYGRYDVDKEDLLNPIFLRSLIELSNAKVIPNTNQETSYGATDIYSNIFDLPEGKELPLNLEMEELMSDQLSGTCTWKSLSAFLRRHLTYSQYHRLTFSLKQQAFWTYSHHHFKKWKIPSEEFTAYLKAQESFANTLENVRQANIITQDEYNLAIGNLKTLQEQLDEWIRQQHTALALSAPQAVIKADSLPKKRIDLTISLPETSQIEMKDSEPLVINVPALFKESKDIVNNIETVFNFCEKAKARKEYDVIVETFQSLTAQLPLPEAENSENYWNYLARHHPTEAVKAIEHLAELHHLFTNALSFSSQGITGKLDPEVILDTYTTLCIVDALLYGTDSAFTGMLNIDPLCDYRFLSQYLGKPVRSKYLSKEEIEKVQKRNFSFQLRNPLRRKRLLDLYDYLEKRTEMSNAGQEHPFSFESPGNFYSFDTILFKKEVNQLDKLSPDYAFFAKVLNNPVLFEQYMKIATEASKDIHWLEAETFNQIAERKSAFAKMARMAQFAQGTAKFCPLYDHWRRLFSESRHILVGIVSPNESFSDSNFSIEEGIRQQGVLDNDRVEFFRYNLLNRLAANAPPCPELSKLYIRSSVTNEYSYIPLERKFKLNFREMKDKQLAGILSILEDNPRLTENEVMVTKPEEYSIKMPTDEFRALLLLATNKPIQIERLLSFYTEHRAHLKDSDHQTFFKYLFFENFVLSEALTKRPELYAIASHFIQGGYQTAKSVGDLPLSIFYLELSASLNNEFKFLKSTIDDPTWQERAKVTQKDLLDFNTHDEIEKWLSLESLTRDERSFLLATFIHLLPSDKKMNDHTLSLILEGIGHLQLFYLSEFGEDPERNRIILRSLAALNLNIQNFVKKDPVSALSKMAGAYPSIAALIPEKKWNLTDYPVCRSDDRDIVINVQTGLIIQEGKTLAALPRSLQSQLKKGMYLPDTPVKILSANQFEFKDPNDNKFCIYTEREEIVKIERTTPDGNCLLLINPVIDDSSVLDDCLIWFDGHILLATKGPEENYRPLYLLSEDQSNYTVERLPTKASEEHLFLQELISGPFEWLSRFESPEEIYLWGTEIGTPRLLEFRRQGLSFTAKAKADGTMTWMSQQHPGFYLASPHHLGALERIGIQNYLLLENKKGEQKVLFSTPIYLFGLQGPFSLEYNLDSSMQTRQFRGTPEACIFLAALALNTRSLEGYSMAKTLLRPQFSIAPNPNKEALQTTKKLLESYNYQEDNHLRAITCRLQAAYNYFVLSKSLKSQEELSVEALRVIAMNLEIYVRKRQKAGTYKLDEEVENLLLAEFNRKELLNINSAEFLAKRNLHSQKDSPVPLRSTEAPGSFDLKTLNAYLKDLNSIQVALSNTKEEDVPNINQLLFTRPNINMPFLFLHFLPKALKKENDPEKKEVRSFLKVAKQDTEKISQVLRAVLEEICDHPKIYSSKISKFTTSQNVDKLIKEVINPALKSKISKIGKPSSKLLPARQARPGRRHSHRTDEDTLYTSRFSNALEETHRRSPVEPPKTDTFLIKNYTEPLSKQRDTSLTPFIRKQLHDVFPTPSQASCFAEQEYLRTHQDIDAYVKNEKGQKEPSAQIPDQAIPEIIHDLSHKIDYRRQKEAYLRKTILEAVNQGYYGDAEAIKHAALHLAGKHDTLTMTDLLIIHGRHEHHLLSTKKGPQLFQAIKNYLDYSNETQKYARGLHLLEEWQTISDIEQKEELKGEALEMLEATTSYNPDIYPERQVIEHLLDLLMRPDQIATIENLEKSQKGMVMQAVPGFGKTTLILPLYCLLCADKNNLSLCVVPDQLKNWICDELKSRLGPIFDVWLRTLDLKATPEMTSSELIGIKDFFEKIRTKGQALIISDTTAHCLNIQRDRALVRSCKSKGIEEKFEAIQRLHHLLDIEQVFQKSKPFGDEAHIWLSSRREVNTSAGDECSLPIEEQLAMITLYDHLLTDPVLKSLIHYDFYPDFSSATSQPFTEELYSLKAKEVLVNGLLDHLQKQPFDDSMISKEIFEFIKNLSDKERQYFKQFINGEKSLDVTAFVNSIKVASVLNVMHLLAQEINVLLPITLKKKCDESYTLDEKVAIPARNGEPLKGSEFGNPHETGNYSIQSIIKHGLPVDLIKTRIKDLQDRTFLEVKEGITLEQTQGYKKFLALSPKNKNRHLFRLSEGEIESIAKEVNASPSSRREFILRFVISEIRFFTSKFNSNCYHLARLMPNMRAVTGTLAENYAYPSHYQIESVKGTDSKAFFALYSHSLSVAKNEINEVPTVTTVKNESPAELLKACKKRFKAGDQIRLVTDAGGYLNGVEIKKMSEEWLDSLQQTDPLIQGVCYHLDGKLVTLEASSKEIMPLKASSLTPGERLTILTQPYVTGTDTKQGNKIVSIVTVGLNTPLSLLIQACWRARKIHRQQKIHFIIAEDVAKVIRTTLKLREQQDIKIGHLLLYTLQNEIHSQEKDNVAGVRLQMQEYLQNLIYLTIKECLEDGIDFDDLLIPEVAALFESHSSREARHLYGGDTEKGDPIKILERDVQKVLERFKEAHKKSPLLQEKVKLEQVEKDLRDMIKLHLLPKEIDTRTLQNNVDTTQEVQIFEEASVEQQKEQSVEQETTVEGLPKRKPEWRRLPWPSLPPNDPALYAQSTGVKTTQAIYSHLPSLPGKQKLTQVLASTKETGRVRSWAYDTLFSLKGALERSLYNNSFFLTMGDFFSTSEESSISNLSTVWDPRLRISFHIATTKSLGPKDRVAQPFDSMHKQTSSILVKRNVATKEWEVNLLDQSDTEFFIEQLASHRETKLEEGWEVVLYDLRLGVIEQGPGDLTAEEIEQSEEAAHLIAQTKFFNGMTEYSPLEEKKLRQWIESEGIQKMRTLFADGIMRHRHNRNTAIEFMEDKFFNKTDI